MPFYEELLAATKEERNELLDLPLIRAGASGHVSLDAYIGFLTEAYHHVKHTVPLLMACGSRLPERYEWLREALAEYIKEELGHLEWILNDIAACGGEKEAVRRGKPCIATELMVSYAYDTIARGNPCGFFGMILVLEGTSVEVATSAGKALQQSLGLGNDAFSYLTSHGALDVGHTDFYATLVNRIDDAHDRQALIHGAKVFYKLYGDIFRHLAQTSMPATHERLAA